MTMMQSIKRKSWEYSIFRKEWHELITGGHQFLFQKWMIFYKKAAIEWTNLYPKLQKKWNIKKGERKKGKLSQRTCLMFLHKALCSKSVTSCPTSLHNFYSTPGKGKGLTHLWESGHCCSPHGYRLCTWTLSFHTNNYKIQKPYRQKFCNSHSHLYKQV